LVNQGHYKDCFEVVCKVEEIQHSAEKNDKMEELQLVTLKCLQYEKAIWDELANKLGDLQEAINRLFL